MQIMDETLKLSDAHRTILCAVIRKAETVCPGSLALIGVYGSAATGDTHAGSDLDLMILIEDERGYALSSGFLLEDAGIGYDLYCTTWEMLERDAECPHAQLGKLLDAKLAYIARPDAAERLGKLREKARSVLASPARYERADAAFGNAKRRLADLFLTDGTAELRAAAAELLYDLTDALMLSRGAYFRRGTKRTFEELRALGLPFDPEPLVLALIRADTPDGLRAAAVRLMREAEAALRVPPKEREEPTAENLAGTYEEMFSNWHGKMREAAARGDVYSSFMNLAALALMRNGIAADVRVPPCGILARFDPDDLRRNAEAFDDALAEYAEAYARAGIAPKRYPDADAFAADYLGGLT